MAMKLGVAYGGGIKRRLHPFKTATRASVLIGGQILKDKNAHGQINVEKCNDGRWAMLLKGEEEACS